MDEFEKYYTIALKFLSHRPRSEKEVRNKLIKKKISLQLLENIIELLKKQKFVNDEEFTKWWIQQRTTFKSKSIRLIKLELLKNGINPETISYVLKQSEFVISSELERAKELVAKNIKKYNNLPRQELYRKLGSFLSRRGFGWGTIKAAIDDALRHDIIKSKKDTEDL